MARYQGVDIAEHFDIAESLGRGGFGEVLGASCKRTGRPVAIKRIATADDQSRDAAIREAEVMMSLDHPSICKLLGFYDCGSHVHLVMERLEGGSLLNEIERRGGLGADVALKIAYQIADALRHAHARGIAHRDVKPENICFADAVEANPTVKLIDWGLAKRFQHAPGGCMTEEVGSAYYAAPEVLEVAFGTRPSGYTCACDLWSLGVVTYEMICGQNPFWGDLDKMIGELVDFEEQQWEIVSAQVKDFVRQLLRAEAADRTSVTIADLLGDHASCCSDAAKETRKPESCPSQAMMQGEASLKTRSSRGPRASQKSCTLRHGG